MLRQGCSWKVRVEIVIIKPCILVTRMNTSSLEPVSNYVERKETGETNNCKQDYFSGNFRKCSQDGYASAQEGTLRQHLKTQPGVQAMWLSICSGKSFKETFENSLWGKNLQMHPMWLCICSVRQFEGTFENSLWRKIPQMHSMCFYMFRFK